ncbi:hypothetical protein [Acetobacter estunensis]|uniref:hypothetical protein n=1 Tax=Acetobacter estunensis TaxID=104097 RepID=UPI001C2CDE48|nr:hypothetical protein [Acetobacter estunensis]MBV1836232.1 hypothetical protein [Acetobacter estunensis]
MTSIRIEHIDTPEGRALWREMLDRMPGLQGTLNYVTAQQDRSSERHLRWYQRELFERWFFRVPCPRTGRMIHSGDSWTVHERKTLFRFPDAPELILASANLGDGFPISTALLPELGAGLTFGSRVWSLTPEEATEALTAFARPEWQSLRPANAAIALCGDENYAHVLWNQLPALQEAARLPHWRGPVTLYSLLEPLGDVRDLLPALKDWPVERFGPYRMPNAPGQVTFCFGSTYIDRQTRLDVLAHARQAVSPSLRRLIGQIGGRFPVVWISVRTGNRTATNQRAFLVALCTGILRHWPKSAILLDGFSLPANHSYRPRDEMVQAVERDRTEIAAIRRAVCPSAPDGEQRVIDASGLSITDSIALAEHASLSVCHHGTIQHKIGWTVGVPGVVHSNRQVLERTPGQWAAEQAEGVAVPYYLPPELVVDEEVDLTNINVERFSLLNGNYRFASPDEAATHALRELARQLRVGTL